MRNLLAAALAYAEQGWPVFMLGRSKRPVANCDPCRTAGTDHQPDTCGHLTCHGFYAATTDPQRIREILGVTPGGLLAIRTGTVSGLAVVDIDPRNGGALLPDLMPPTYCVRTGSNGWHLYYRHPRQPLAGKLAGHDGIDIKTDGGYVVAPPSIHPATGRPYRQAGNRPVVEMPPPLLAACRPAPVPTPMHPVPPITAAGGGGISSPAALLNAHLSAVARAPEGRRRTTLYGAARGVARLVAAGLISHTDAHHALTHAGRAAGQTDRDIRAAIRGGFTAEHVATEGTAA
ncbi:bifunctional DNA primase/polymerase [Polymorphospora rubra]|uniref:DNA primase/polymerase bifunctional N-terminal domain-containing protein n=1 Tax=Polymorphospora rubra TaxID=338584 RepID=A0A810N2A0_9ACTN|nr:bifunctional DNA primase/polymerase [Polymorphospora rubra]BCJ65873.1 hypothetical protein Prubr_28940 [Polymorphospora rubra]